MNDVKFAIPQWALDTAVEGLQELARRLEDDAAAFSKVDSPEGRIAAQNRLERAWEAQKAHEFFISL